MALSVEVDHIFDAYLGFALWGGLIFLRKALIYRDNYAFRSNRGGWVSRH